MTGPYPSRYGVVAPAYGEIFDDDTVTLPAIADSPHVRFCIALIFSR